MAKKICMWLDKNNFSCMQIRNDGNMYPCCVRWIPLSDEPSKYKDYKNLRLEDIQDLRKKLFNEINEGKHKECQECPLLYEISDSCNDPVGAIKHLVYHPHTLCTIDCKYCFYTTEQKNTPIPKEYEDVYEVIKHFYDIGLLNKENFALDLGGGEPTLLKNIGKTLDFLSKTWEKPAFHLLSNATATEKINDLIRELKGKYKNVQKSLVTSIDCGTRETYIKIKNKDCFYQVANNLYNCAKNNVFTQIILKYIFLDDLSNADDDNIFGFLYLCKFLNEVLPNSIKIALDIDWLSRKHNDDLIPDEILKTIGKVYYFVTEVMSIECYFMSDYLNKTTTNGTIALDKITQYADDYEKSNKTQREIEEINILNSDNLIPPPPYINVSDFENEEDSSSLKNKLQIVIITYNRKPYLARTLKQLLSPESPVRELDIIVLDNDSTDGTGKMTEEFCRIYPNVKHIKNRINIGGNPNVAKVYTEYTAKEYTWLLCDNDKYCWSNFSEIENAINDGYDVIFTQNCKDNIADMYYKATFAPACIYKTENITPTVVENMYDNIRYLFPHLAIFAWNLNHNNKIFIPEYDTVIQEINPEDNRTVLNRGFEAKYIPLPRKNILWLVGYINSVELITDRKKQTEIIEGCRHHHKSLFELFKTFMIQNKYDKENYSYNYSQIFRLLNLSQKIRFILAYLAVNLSLKNHKYYEIRTYEDWTEYLDKIDEQKYINILSKVLKGKKVLLYGAGIVSKVLIDNYDLTGLNIVGVADKKFDISKENLYKNYKAIKPSELKEYDFDYILFTMKLYKNIETDLKSHGITQKTLPLIKKDRKYVLRVN